MRARLTGNLTRWFVGHGAFAKYRWDMMLSDGIDNLAYLLGRTLLIGIDRPQIQLLEIVITS